MRITSSSRVVRTPTLVSGSSSGRLLGVRDRHERLGGLRGDDGGRGEDDAAVEAKAAPKPVESASAPATSGPTRLPASPAIWYAAITVPPRPPTTSPSMAPGATSSSPLPKPNTTIATMNTTNEPGRISTAQPAALPRQPADQDGPATAAVGEAPGHPQRERRWRR